MKIGVIASTAHRLPPVNYGPREQIAATLADGFVARGHDVTVFATADSVSRARVHGVATTGYDDDATIDATLSGASAAAAAMERAASFEVLVNQAGFVPLTYSRLVKTPMVTAIHGLSSDQKVDLYRQYDDIGHYVAISDANRHADLTYAATIHHGVELGSFSFVPEAGEYLLFLGRIHPDKGTHRAIDVAKRAGLPLIIAGPVTDPEYFERTVKPHVDGTAVQYVGPVGPDQRSTLLGGARALLHLISFTEPFGLSVVEALATGTPVIATPLGSMPELIRDKVTGFLVRDVADAVAAVRRLDEIDRRACRRDAQARFGSDRMVDDYLALLESILDARRPKTYAQSIGSVGLFSDTPAW